MQQPDHGGPQRRRSHREEHEEHAVHDESNWLVSYADMMTLLFGFFVLMYAFSRIDTEKFEVVSKEVAKYFGGEVKENPAIIAVKKDIKEAINQYGKAASVTNIPGGIQLSFNSQILFDSGSARLRPEAHPVLTKIVENVQKKVGIREVRVEGHTDDDPIYSQIFPTNWELSAARAARIVRQFEASNIPSHRLIAEGFGSSRPEVQNRGPDGTPIKENQQRNRRVMIDIMFDTRVDEAIKALASKDMKVKRMDQDLDVPEMVDDNNIPPAASLEERMKAARDRVTFARTQLQEARVVDKERQKQDALRQRVQEMERQAEQMLKEAAELKHSPKAQ